MATEIVDLASYKMCKRLPEGTWITWYFWEIFEQLRLCLAIEVTMPAAHAHRGRELLITGPGPRILGVASESCDVVNTCK